MPKLQWGSSLGDLGETQRRPSLLYKDESASLGKWMDEIDFNTKDKFQSGFSFYKRIHSRTPLTSQLP